MPRTAKIAEQELCCPNLFGTKACNTRCRALSSARTSGWVKSCRLRFELAPRALIQAGLTVLRVSTPNPMQIIGDAEKRLSLTKDVWDVVE